MAEKSSFPTMLKLIRYTLKGALRDADIDLDKFLANI
jgi:hypothetical protein